MLTPFGDDLAITGPSNASVADIGSMLMEKFAVSDLGDVSQILGIEVNGRIQSRIQYTLLVLGRFNMSEHCNPVHVPGIGKELGAQHSRKEAYL